MAEGRVRVLNAGLDPVSADELVERIMADVAAGRRGWVTTLNVAVLVMMRDSPRLQSYVDRARWVVADGMPLVWEARRAGTPLPERVGGVDLVRPLCRRAAADGVGVHLLGATAEVTSRLSELLRTAHPGLDVTWQDGYFDEREASERAARVAGSGARILLVGMGVPRQEHFVEDHWEELGVTTAIGLGGSFDVLTGHRTRAPGWVQRSGLEWAWRLVQEPRRLGPRYAETNARFLLALSAQAVKGGRQTA